ncbi:hypothetical protein Tco_1306518, partial [Tanacetum coccineum]
HDGGDCASEEGGGEMEMVMWPRWRKVAKVVVGCWRGGGDERDGGEGGVRLPWR